MHAHCNDDCDIYVDGNRVGGSNSTTSWSGTIPKTSRLIAVEAKNSEDVGSIFISVSNGFRSSQQLMSRWKCSNDIESVGWTKTNFVDGGWTDAEVTANQSSPPLNRDQGQV